MINENNFDEFVKSRIHHEPLSTSFFSKNLIIPEAVIFSKRQSVTHVLGFKI